MGLNVLIADPMNDWRERVAAFLNESHYQCAEVVNGKSAQLKVYQERFFALILDWELKDHSALEVIKYMSLNAPSTKVILTTKSLKVFEELGIDRKDIIKLGVTDVLLKPYNKDQLLKSIAGELQFGLWKNVSRKRRNTGEESGVIHARDDEFTRINVQDYFSGKIAIFDLFIRLSPDHYVKILHAGESFDPEIIKKYKEGKNLEFFYFRTQDRGLYIRHLNMILEKLEKLPQKYTEKQIQLVKNVTEKFVEEIYTSGIRPNLVEEGGKICAHIEHLSRQDKNLAPFVRKLQDFDPTAYSHAFLIVFFSSLVCRKLTWATKGTMEKVTIGAMLHDIGKIKLPKSILLLRPEKMNNTQLKDYKCHPQAGVDMLEGSPILTESTRQIIFQHHETVDGAGFPRGLTGMKIYPLAKVVGMVDYCVGLMTSKKISPPEAYVMMVKQEGVLAKYDSSLLRAFGEIFLTGQVKL